MVSFTADLTIDENATTPHVNVSDDDLISLSIGNADIEVRLCGSLADLTALVLNLQDALDFLSSPRFVENCPAPQGAP